MTFKNPGHKVTILKWKKMVPPVLHKSKLRSIAQINHWNNHKLTTNPTIKRMKWGKERGCKLYNVKGDVSHITYEIKPL